MSVKVNDSKLMPLKKCPVCHGMERKQLFDLDLYGVYECSGCRLRYIDPCLSSEGMQYYYSSEEKLLELNPFHSDYYEYGDPAVQSRTVCDFERALRLTEPDVSSPERKIFDIGCGNGLFLAVAKRRGWAVSGCEPSASNVALAKKKFGIDIYCASFDQFDPANEKYDVVSAWDVLEHLVDPHAFIKKAMGMLKPGGRIIIGGPNDRSLLRIMATAIYHITVRRIHGPLRKVYLLEHVSYYAIETLKSLFAEHGFTLQTSFFSSTDLEKYFLSVPDKIMASFILFFGKLLGFQNRFVAIFELWSPSSIKK